MSDYYSNPDSTAGPLFAGEAKKMTRTSHPKTSHQAAEKMVKTGSAEYFRRIGEKLVRENPGLTAYELDELYSEEKAAERQVSRRLSEVAVMKQTIKRGPSRPCNSKFVRSRPKSHKTRFQTWFPVEVPKWTQQQPSS